MLMKFSVEILYLCDQHQTGPWLVYEIQSAHHESVM